MKREKTSWKNIFLAITIAVVGLAISGGIARAAEDTTPPEIKSFSITPTTFDTTSGSATLTATMRITDAESGVNSNAISVMIVPADSLGADPNYTQHFTISLNSRTSGDEHDGIYTGTATVGQYAKSGNWTILSVVVGDNKYNVVQYGSAAELLTAVPGATGTTITNNASNSDATPPEIKSFSITPTEFNTDSGSATLTVTARITDAQTGFKDCAVVISSQGSNPVYASGGLYNSNRISGDEHDGTYSGTITVNQNAPAGTWTISDVHFFDNIGNGVKYGSAQELLAAVPSATGTSLNNTGSLSDSTPPETKSFSITPTEFNTDSGPATLTMTMRVTDIGTGVCPSASGDCGAHTEMSLEIMSVIGYEEVDFKSFHRISGDKNDGIYTGTATVNQGAKQGFYRIIGLSVVDQTGNRIFYNTPMLAAALPDATTTIANTASADSVSVGKEWIISGNNTTVTIPAGTVITKKDGGSFALYKMISQAVDIGDLTTDGLTGTTVSTIKMGIPGLNLSFSQPVTIRLLVDSQYEGSTLTIDSLQEGASSWANETSCTVSGRTCQFTVNHATYFTAVKASANSNVTVSANISTISYSLSKKAKARISYTYHNLSLTQKKYVTAKLNGRKVKVVSLRRSGSDSIVTVELKYGRWPAGNYNLAMSYKNQVKVPYIKKGKTKYRKGWESGSVTSENILSII